MGGARLDRARAYARACALVSFALLAGCLRVPADLPSARAEPAPPRPNILLIVVDDMGQADLGSFGGEIETPNLDALANRGLRFASFHTAPTCSPTRSMLLTGVDSHRAGLGNMAEEVAPNQQGKPGYEGHLRDSVVTLAERLRDVGYRTMMTGKWHLGTTAATVPSARGFERSFSLVTGGAHHFGDMRPAYAPTSDAKADYWENGRQLTELPPSFEYSSQFYVDRLIDYLDAEPGSGQPFFAYLAFTAPHWPLQAPDAAIAKYRGRYDAGYDELARRRLARQKVLGIVPAGAALAERSPGERPWVELSTEERRGAARAMEVYAAMIDEVDRHTGRLLDHLRRRGQLANTVVVFMSDNGAEGHDLDGTWPRELFPEIRGTIDATHDFSFERMGRPGSYTLYGPGWARAGSPALRLYKAFPTEGGTRTAAFVSGGAAVSRPGIVEDTVTVQDLAPTLLELAGVPWAGDRYRGRVVEPITGRSILPLLRHEVDALPPRVTGTELFGKRAIRAGSWKLVFLPRPYGTGDWQLFDLATDFAERHDLARERPDKVAELRAHWVDYARANQVVLPDWVSGY